MKKFYIASSFANKEAVRTAANSLIEKGFTQTFDWTANLRASTIDELQIYGELERNAVLEADFLVVILPAGKGSHIEMGIAIGQRKTVYLVSESPEFSEFDVTSTFYHLPEVSIHIGTMGESISRIFENESTEKSVQ
ncbi:group-specific protein [Metaplanococcus flavidus]|uniref:Group-specific protein n=1 Tax=Metaplanococcus flavidus TaxID=569883 RepID=A0ABW3L7L0_9BACL